MKQLHDARAPTGARWFSLKYVLAAAGLAVLAGILILPNLVINPFVVGRMTQELAEAFPSHTVRIDGLRYDVWTNRLSCDAITVSAPDSALVFSADGVFVSGVDRIPLLFGSHVTPAGVANAHAEARGVVLPISEARHELRCAVLRISYPDSSLTIDDLLYQPPAGDEQFFAGSAYRKTRYRLAVPRVLVTGLDPAMPWNGFRARALHAGDPSLSVTIDMKKPEDGASTRPRMPLEMLASLGIALQIESVFVANGRLAYEERWGAAFGPAVLSFDGIQIAAEGIGNAAGGTETVAVQARGILMGAAELRVRMSTVVGSPGLSFRYSGSLGAMSLSRLNRFVEAAEGIRLKTGLLHSAGFDIVVKAGRAAGVTRVVYEDLKVVVIDRRTGSEDGIGKFLVSFFANNIKLRTTNVRDGSDSIKVGEVRYKKKLDETFLEFAWFAIRDGINDVVGI